MLFNQPPVHIFEATSTRSIEDEDDDENEDDCDRAATRLLASSF
jgi:hypothetical protein